MVRSEDWRLRLEVEGEGHARWLAERLEASDLERTVVARLGHRIVASRDGAVLFFYADSESAAREAEKLVRSVCKERGTRVEGSISRWHPDAEDWESPGAPLPSSGEARATERQRLMAREDQETKDRGDAEWEVRVELPSHQAARDLESQLADEGVDCVRRWRYLLVGMSDEDQAHDWARRIQSEAPPGTKATVEGTFQAAMASRPFTFMTLLGGGL